MSLSSELISQFAKLNKPTKKIKKETTVYGTVVIEDDEIKVKIDGSNFSTPAIPTTDIADGDRVTVLIKNHTAIITGNITYPAAKAEDVKDVASNTNSVITRVETLEKNTGDIGNIKDVAYSGSYNDLIDTPSPNDQKITFSEASTRSNIVSGETLSVVLGKVRKYFTDLKTVAFTGSYNDLTDKPEITPGGGEANVQSDWNVTDTESDAYIKNKPTIPSADTYATKSSVTSLENRVTTLENSGGSSGGSSGCTPWALLGKVTGTTTINLPASFEELHILISESSMRINVNVLYDELSDSPTRYYGGGYHSTSACCRSLLDVSKTTCALYKFSKNGSDITSSATVTVYYR